MNIENVLRSLYLQSKVIEDGGKKYVVKCYGSNVGLKWYFISSVFRSFPYVASPKARMSREIDFMTYTWKKVRVPTIVDLDTDEKCIVREYIDGRIPNSVEDFVEVAHVLREIHEEDFALGDTKYENFLINNGVWVIDAEEAVRTQENELKAWDLLVYFLFISYKFIQDVRSFERVVKEFLSIYVPDREVVLKALSLRNVQLLSMFPPLHLTILRKAMSEF
ncbi:MAG: serine/threonine protein kinase [Metallosphaera yellowstonensis]|jgi:Mn2+-dependent serine/threonine protein kinase